MQAEVWPQGWPTPNYVDPPTRGSPSLFIAISVITTAVVALRLYSRFVVTRSPGADDTFIVAGFVRNSFNCFLVFGNRDPNIQFVDSINRPDGRNVRRNDHMWLEQAPLGRSPDIVPKGPTCSMARFTLLRLEHRLYQNLRLTRLSKDLQWQQQRMVR